MIVGFRVVGILQRQEPLPYNRPGPSQRVTFSMGTVVGCFSEVSVEAWSSVHSRPTRNQSPFRQSVASLSGLGVTLRGGSS